MVFTILGNYNFSKSTDNADARVHCLQYSETNLQSKLQNAHRGAQIPDLTDTRRVGSYRTGRNESQVGRLPEKWSVERIEGFATELQLQLLGQREILEHRKIEV